MNDSIFKFKRYEDSSLSYTDIDKHEGKDIGGWDTVIKREEYERLFFNQQSTMVKPGIAEEPEVEEKERPVPEAKSLYRPLPPSRVSSLKPTASRSRTLRKHLWLHLSGSR